MTEHACSACMGEGLVVSAAYTPMDCPVCLGAGRFSDRMPVADAMADAETLRLYARDGMLFNGTPRQQGWELRIVANPSYGARKHIRRGWADRAAKATLHAARYVFRAVPGLRG